MERLQQIVPADKRLNSTSKKGSNLTPEVEKQQELINKRLIKLKKKAKILIGIGSFIIFLSWIAQNFMYKQRQDELDQMYKRKINIAVNEINKNSFSIFKNLLENNKDVTEESLIYAYFGYCLYANTVHHQGIIMASNDKDEQSKNQELYDNNVKDLLLWKDQRNVKALKWFSERLSEWENDNGSNTVATFQNRYLELKQQEKTANYVHLIIYIIGALFLGWAFVLEYKMINIESAKENYKSIERPHDSTKKKANKSVQ